MRVFRTLLEQKIWERRQTFEEFVEATEVFAREHGEPGSIGVRHLQRLAAGRGAGGRPLGPVRPATARLLERIFGVSVDELLAPPGGSSRGPQREEYQPGAEWLDELGESLPDSTRRKVAARLDTLDLGWVRDRGARLRSVRRSRLARALANYYAEGVASYRLYGTSVDGHGVLTSVLTRPEWSELALPLRADTDRIMLADSGLDAVGRIERVDQYAVDRVAEAAALGVRITNKPLYRLLDVEIGAGVVAGQVGLAPFGLYALTMDLLERELADAVADQRPVRQGNLPLRDRYLPDVASVLGLQERLCAGGVAGLCAIARSADVYRGPADYALLVQERSGQVVNAAGRLADRKSPISRYHHTKGCDFNI